MLNIQPSQLSAPDGEVKSHPPLTPPWRGTKPGGEVKSQKYLSPSYRETILRLQN